MTELRELPKYDLIPIGGRNLNGATFIPQVAPSYSPTKAFRPNKIFRSIAQHYSTTLGQQEKKKGYENRRIYKTLVDDDFNKLLQQKNPSEQ